jgi:imidazolonepropionase-like amidohydrolase
MGRLVIKAGRLVDGTGAPVRTGVALIAEGRFIKEIVPLAALRILPDDEVVDATGRTVLPGLIDAHVHIHATRGRTWLEGQLVTPTGRLTLDAWRNAWSALEMGYTTLRDMASRDYLDVALREMIEAGELAGPRLRVSGNGLTMYGGHMAPKTRPEVSVALGHTGVCNTPDEARAAARYQIAQGVDIVKLNTSGGEYTDGGTRGVWQYQELDLDMIQAAVEQAARVGRYCASHCHGGEGAMNTIIGGVKTIEHAHWLTEAHFEEMLKRDAILVPTWTVIAMPYEAWQAGRFQPPKPEWLKACREAKFRSVELAIRMGVKIAAGSDAGFSVIHHGLNARELEFLVANGMSPLEAIRATTSVAAETMNLQHKVGTLKPGFWCDAIVVDGDPTREIKLLQDRSRIGTVIKDGQVVLRQASSSATA